MMAKIENFGSLRVAHRSSGEPVRLTRSLNEVVFLAFDSDIQRLVELHLLGSGNTLDSVSKKAAFKQAQRFSQLDGASFTRILSVQETQGLVSYTSALNDGESITSYIQRRGPLQPTMAYALVLQLLEDVLLIGSQGYEISRLGLDQVMMTTLEDTFLQLRVYDFDLSSIQPEGETLSTRQLCQLLFLMLTGDVYAGQHPDRYHVLTALPMALRTVMRACLMDPASSLISLERLRDHVREAFSAIGGAINAKSLRKQRLLAAALQPRSELQDSLLENMQLHEILGNRFQATVEEGDRCYPFSLPCLNVKNQMPVTVQVLPSSRIVDRAEYQAAPTQMWGDRAETQPNVLRCLSVWQGPEWTFLTEERVPGFPLSRLLAERVFLNPVEVAVLLHQIIAGQRQAEKGNVQRLDLHPSNILLCVGKEGPLMQRDHERLMEKRLDVWPNLRVKVRAHWTMHHFYEAPLAEISRAGQGVSDSQHQSLMIVALAAYLLTGQRAKKETLRFPEATPPLLADFVRECLDKSHQPEQLPSAVSFVTQFESLLSATSQNVSLAARLSAPRVALEEMESMGSVSDFEEEWESPPPPVQKTPTVKISASIPQPTVFGARKSISWELLAAAALVMVAMVGGWLVVEKTQAKTAFATSKEAVEASAPNQEDVLIPVAKSAPQSLPPAAQLNLQPAVQAEPPPLEKPPTEKPVKVVMKMPKEPLKQVPAPPAPTEAPMPAPAEVEVVRKAILPSSEEIEKFKQSLSPQPAAEKSNPAFPFSPQVPVSIGVRSLNFSAFSAGPDLNRQ